MMKIIELEKIDYTPEETLGNEIDALNELETDESNYICDAISQIADDYVPIYNSELWEHAADIQEDIEEAIAAGLCDTNKPDLIRIFQAGYYQHYTRIIYENLFIIAKNVLINYVNNLKLEESKKLEYIETKIEELAENYDHNNSWNDLRQELKTWIDEQIAS